jgi:putative transposase
MAALFRSRTSLSLEHLALRHQLAVYQRSVPRPRLRATARLFWAWVSRLWAGWQSALVFVQPRTVMAWQRRRFRDDWRQLSRQGTPGCTRLAKERRALIRTMWQANPSWGAPRLVGELRKLGLNVANSTVETYRLRPERPSSLAWKTFVNNHVQDLGALDCLVVPTVRHTGLFVLVILAHHRRRVVHCNVTEHPTAQWTAQQMVEAFPWETAPRYLLRDRDRIDGVLCRQRLQNMGMKEVVIAPRHPWQNPYVEGLIGSLRRACLDHVIVRHERHWRRLLTDYVHSYHRWRTHQALDMDCPVPRPVQRPGDGAIRDVSEGGGVPHHDERRAA